jgi:chromosome segregation ATPase
VYLAVKCSVNYLLTHAEWKILFEIEEQIDQLEMVIKSLANELTEKRCRLFELKVRKIMHRLDEIKSNNTEIDQSIRQCIDRLNACSNNIKECLVATLNKYLPLVEEKFKGGEHKLFLKLIRETLNKPNIARQIAQLDDFRSGLRKLYEKA